MGSMAAGFSGEGEASAPPVVWNRWVNSVWQGRHRRSVPVALRVGLFTCHQRIERVHQGVAGETDLGGKHEKNEAFYSSRGPWSPFLA